VAFIGGGPAGLLLSEILLEVVEDEWLKKVSDQEITRL
jgi:hypothetical protein